MLGPETAVYDDGLIGCFRGLVMNNEGENPTHDVKYLTLSHLIWF